MLKNIRVEGNHHGSPCLMAEDDTHRYHIWLDSDLKPELSTGYTGPTGETTVYKNPLPTNPAYEPRRSQVIRLTLSKGLGKKIGAEMLAALTPEMKAAYMEHCMATAAEEREGRARSKRNYAIVGAAHEMYAALKLASEMCTKALDKFNWGASALDAESIDLLNRAPAAIRTALDKAENP